VTVQDIRSTVAQYLARSAPAMRSITFAAAIIRVSTGGAGRLRVAAACRALIASSIGAASSRLVMSLLLRKRTVSQGRAEMLR